METNIIFLLIKLLYMSLQICAEVLFLPINWTEVNRVKSLQNNDPFLPFEVSSMPACDLTAHSCDLKCCVDPDCTLEQLQILKCSRFEFDTDEWQLLTSSCIDSNVSSLCVHANNAAILGYYYKDMGKFENFADFQKRTQDISHYRFINTSSPSVMDKDLENVYSFGSNVHILEHQASEIKPMLLPYPTVGATSCSGTTSVPVLVDKMWTCRWPFIAEDCEAVHSPFHLLQYAFCGVNESVWQEIDVFPPKVVKNLGKKSFTESSISLQCYKNGSEYIIMSSNYFGITQESHLRSKIPTYKDNDLIKDCKDLYTLINTSYDVKRGICQNMVLGIDLEFIWHENEIIKMNARYALVDVPIPPDSKSQEWVLQKKRFKKRKHFNRFVTQNFKVGFKYYYNEKTSNKSIDSNDVTMRSGNPGYLFGRPLITGTLRINGTDITWEDLPLELWRGGGPCDAGRPVLFGHNAYTTCRLQIASGVLGNCTALREAVRRAQGRLVRGQWAARAGDRVNLTSANSLLPILFDRSRGWDESEEEDDDGASCGGVPTHLSIHVLYDDWATVGADPTSPPSGFLAGVAISFDEGRSPWMEVGPGREANSLLLSSSVTFDRIPSDRERREKSFWVNLSEKNARFFALQNMKLPRMDAASLAVLSFAFFVGVFLLCHLTTRRCNSRIL